VVKEALPYSTLLGGYPSVPHRKLQIWLEMYVSGSTLA
jgi:hypothetical protein